MDDLDRLILRMQRLDARARVGALDEVNAQKLAYSEFGTVNEPPRPTLSAATDRNVNAVQRAVERRVALVVAGKSTQAGQDILADVAEDLAEEVQNEIDGSVPPALAPSTLANRRRRGNASERTLVDTGDMLRSIKVESKRGDGGWPDE
jgi:hypothetical protein